MLPTKGYFQDIECPYYDNACNRPYCHFRHRKKPQEAPEEVTIETATEPEVPTYKPTPKSELANIKSSHIPISYVPDLAFRPERDRTIRPIPKFSFEKPTYKPTPLSILSSANKREDDLDDDEKETGDDIETIREIKQNIASVEYNPEVSLQDDINFEELSAEFDMIDDIIHEPNPNDKKNNSSNSKENDVKKKENDVKRKENDVKRKENDVKRKENDVKKKENDVKKKENDVKKKEKPTVSLKSHESNKDVTKDKEKRSSSSSSKSHKSKHHKKDTKEKVKEESKDKHSKDKEIKSDKSKHKEKHSDHKSTHKSSKEKEKSKSRDKDKRKSSKSKERDKEKHKEKRPKHDSTEEKKRRPKSSESSSDGHNELLEINDFDEYSDLDYGDEDTLSECYKIFTEYEPPKIETREPPTTEAFEESKEELALSKKRIAHSSANVSEIGSKIHYVKPKIQASAAQIMANRLKLAKLAQASDEQRSIMNEMRVQQTAVKRPPPTLLEAARSYKLQKMSRPKPSETSNLVDSILNNSKKPKKIAPVQNVNSIQRAKARIDELAKQKATEALSKTPAQTAKGTKRVAHVPDISLSDIPDVLNADKSKLPINVRTRFLTMLADECVKLYLKKEHAFNRALSEEFGCYEKCKVLITYKNSAMLAVNRLRKELQEREKLGLGPIGDGESSTKTTSSDFKGLSFYNHVKKYILTEEELELHGYPRESQIPGRATVKNRKTHVGVSLGENQRKCSRCSKIYLVDEDGFVLYEEECIYHPLKKRTFRGEQTYLCCKSSDDIGCATSNTHVSESCEEGDLEGYQITMEPESDEDPRNHSVYALDCEMCYTIKGLELTRVTIVDSDCKTVYESLVKPLNPIIDYNTTFSGITREQMERTSTGILQVQANILHLCNSKTILIGHSLESDMKALKIIHGTVVDTSVLFPHKMGLPHKRALKALASEHLKKIIQNNVSGHDSAEDAIACMELVKWKLKEELKVRGVK